MAHAHNGESHNGEHHDHEHHEEEGMYVDPLSRTRRTRMTARHRRLVRETHLHPSNFMLPLFVTEAGRKVRNPISSMPGVEQLGIEPLLQLCEEALTYGIGGVILFGIPNEKDAEGSGAFNPKGIVQVATKEIKSKFPELLVATDLCLCEYTESGHCGIVDHRNGDHSILNDETIQLLMDAAIAQADAGSDLIAPSDMMDGRIAAIRAGLDMSDFVNLPIMAYSAKFASAFYGPFRDAAGSAPVYGDRRSHQLDPANGREAMRVLRRDADEGADILMVKPALSSLDIIRQASNEFDLPIAAYQVSGEYAMIKAASQNGWLDEERAFMESLVSIRRAGADIILTYYALEAAKLLKREDYQD